MKRPLPLMNVTIIKQEPPSVKARIDPNPKD